MQIEMCHSSCSETQAVGQCFLWPKRGTIMKNIGAICLRKTLEGEGANPSNCITPRELYHHALIVF